MKSKKVKIGEVCVGIIEDGAPSEVGIHVGVLKCNKIAETQYDYIMGDFYFAKKELRLADKFDILRARMKGYYRE